jgi:hypothetical protein
MLKLEQILEILLCELQSTNSQWVQEDGFCVSGTGLLDCDLTRFLN